MSTLTKILIILLTLSSFFLCGIVVMYVANVDNYRQKYNDLKSDSDALRASERSLKKQINEEIEKAGQKQESLKSELASLKLEIAEVKNALQSAEREKASLIQKVNNWTSIVKDFSETNEQQGRLLDNTLNELKKVQTEQVKERKELNETTAALVEKMAIIDALETAKKRILEEKIELQSRLDQLLRPTGKVALMPQPVTAEKDVAHPVETALADIDLKGFVTGLDLKNSIASISIGTADGVAEGMRFHVTRGDEFICDILIIDAEKPEEAVGVLELVQKTPKIGDNVTSTL